MKHLLRLTLFLMLLCCATVSRAQKIQFAVLTSDQGLSHAGVPALLQDSQGFIWAGTKNGLNRYDGYAFTVYKNGASPNTISDNVVTSLYEDSKGIIWVGTENGLNAFDRKKDRFTRYFASKDPKSISNNSITGICEDSQGNLWVGTSGGCLNRFDRQTGTFTRIQEHEGNPTSIQTKYIKGIHLAKNGTLWITHDFGLSKLVYAQGDSVGFVNYVPDPANPNAIPNRYAKMMAEDNAGKFWVVSDGGLSYFDPNTGEFQNYSHQPGDPTSLANNYAKAVSIDENGDVWVGTDGGISIFNPNTRRFTHYTNDVSNPRSLSNNYVKYIMRDRIGAIWVGTDAGINIYDAGGEQFSLMRYEQANPNSLSSNNVFAIYEAKDGLIWIGTDNGINVWDRATNQMKRYAHDPNNPNSLTNNYVKAFREDKWGNMWVGTDGGLNKMSWDKAGRLKIKRFYHEWNNPKTITNNAIVSIFEDSRGKLWIGTWGGGINVFDSQTDEIMAVYRPDGPTAVKGLNSDQVRSFYEDETGTLWVAIQGGIAKYDPGTDKFRIYGTDLNNANSLSNNRVEAIAGDGKGVLWIGTNGGGLNKFNAKTGDVRRYFDFEGLASNAVQAIVLDHKGMVWISTSRGLSRLDPKTEKFVNYDVNDGLQGNEFNIGAATVTRSGELFFGGVRGLNYFYPEKILPNQYIPPVFITQFSLMNWPVSPEDGENAVLQEHISLTKEIRLSHDQKMLTFDFVALNYRNAIKNKYAFKLENFDKEWNYTHSGRRFATYTNLSPGEYTLRIIASNNDGVWNEDGVSLRIVITPPFWEEWWFKLIVAAAVIGMATMFYKIRVAQIKAQKFKLEREVELRTAEIQQQKEEIQAQRDNLERANAELGQKNFEINQQKEEIEAQRDNIQAQKNEIVGKNQQIMASIRYAKTIQQAVLPPAAEMQRLFNELFVIYRPKDIVSGDFYWCSKVGDLVVLAVVDCTGHGVPGAFMSMISHSMISDLVEVQDITDPAEILERLHSRIVTTLNQAQGMNGDGMDLGICVVYPHTGDQRKIVFAGAKNALFRYDKGEGRISRVRGNNRSIGGLHQHYDSEFTNQELWLASGDAIYMTTDGYADQCDPQRQKFGSLRLSEHLTSIADQPMAQQQAYLEKQLDDFMNGIEQRDDITFIGFKP